jgi:hypothetical protein
MLGSSQLGTWGPRMQKVFLSVTLALLMALAVVGVQQAVGASHHAGTTLVAEGGVPLPPDWRHEGGVPLPPDSRHEGGVPLPPDSF